MKKCYYVKTDYLKKILEMLLSFSDGSELFERDIEKLKMYIDRVDNSFADYTDNRSLISKINEDISTMRYYDSFCPLIRQFHKTGADYSERFSARFEKKIISDKEALDTACDFFSEHGTFYSEIIADFLSDAPDHLEFISPNNNTAGEMVFLETVGEAFVFVPNYPNICKVTTLIHELEHVVDSFQNPNFHYNLIVREIPPLFMEMIGSDYVSNKYGVPYDGLLRRMEIYNIVKSDNKYLSSKLYLLRLVSRFKITNDMELYSLLNRMDFDEGFARFLEEEPLDKDFYYQISFLVALELYKIYTSDKKKALEILEYIIMYATNDNLLDILELFDIKLASSVMEYEDDLVKKLKIR